MKTKLYLQMAGLLLATVTAGLAQPIITQQPQNQTNAVGATATFTVTATNGGALAYQWQKYLTDWTALADRTNATLVLTNVQTSDEADYRVAITNLDGAINSAAAHLYVIVPPAIVVQPKDQAVALGTYASFSVTVTGSSPFSYQWRWEGAELANATNSSLTFAHAGLTNAGVYAVCVTNFAGAVTSGIVQLSVAEGWVFTNAAGTRLPYRLFLPPNYDPGVNYPLVLFWHGAGETGTDNLRQLSGFEHFSFLTASNLAKFPCFCLAPQLPYFPNTCDEGFSFFDCATNLLSQLEGEYSIDLDRIYVTGLSMGGHASWMMVARYPELLAAAIPMSGVWVCHSIEDFLHSLHVPIWNFHAANDDVVAVGGSDLAVAYLRGTGANVLYTRYQFGGHAIWPVAYKTPGLVDWVMAQRRGMAPTNEPLLSITNPTGAAVYLTGATSLNLAGSAGALGEAVTLVSWTNLANNVQGTAAGSNTWTVTSVPLVANRTNLIVLTATTTSWWSPYGGDTTFNDTLTVIQSPIRVTLTWQGPHARLNWTGGGPPYRVQRATNLAAGDWEDYLTDATPPVNLPLTGQAGFYRIFGQ